MKTGLTKMFVWLCCSAITFGMSAQIPANYYKNVDGKNKGDLKTAFYSCITDHKTISYDGLWTAFKTTDVKPNGTVWDMYTDIPDGTPNGSPKYVFRYGSGQCGNYKNEGDCYNREHSFPKSWFNDASPMYSDVFHLYPTDGKVNGMRSNYAYGNVGTATFTSSNGSKLGKAAMSGYSGTVFEPIDEYKGDFARSYFYMVTCYENRISSWSSPHLNGSKYPGFNQWSIDLLLEWSRLDPVSRKEIDRNNAAYVAQQNRNPYIDFPGLEEYVWGNKMSEAFDSENPDGKDPKVNASIESLAFTTTTLNAEASQSVKINAYNLTGDLTVTIIGDNEFTTTVSQISKADAESGYSISVGYTPTQYGSNSGAINISGGGLASTYSIGLTGVASPFSGDILNAPFATSLDGFTPVSVSGTQEWSHDATGGYAKMSGYVNANYANEDWLISPSIDFTKKKDIILTFDHTGRMFDGKPTMTDDLTLWISNDYVGGQPSSSTWTQVIIPTYMSGDDWKFVSSGPIDLTPFKPANSPSKSMKAAGNMRIAFKFVSTNTYSGNWEIKNVVIKAVEEITGITNDKNNENVSVYSTPGYINVDVKSKVDGNIEVYDTYGRLVAKQRIESGNNQLPVSARQFFIVKVGNSVSKVMSK